MHNQSLVSDNLPPLRGSKIAAKLCVICAFLPSDTLLAFR